MNELGRHAASPAELQEQLVAARGGSPFLLYRDGEGEQQIVRLEGLRAVTVGRDEQADVALGWDSLVSRLHAEFECVSGQWTVVDDGLSTNGSFVNGERVTGRRRLRDGDALRFGRTHLLFRAPALGSSSTTTFGDDLPSAATLSPAQRRVLVALCRPFKEGSSFATPATNSQIAEELVLSVDAIKTHMRSLFHIFDVDEVPQNQKRVQLVERALNTGVITVRDLGAG